MAMVNGKVVGSKVKKAKKVLDKAKAASESKHPVKEGWEKFKKELEESAPSEIKRPKKAKKEEPKKTRKETSESVPFRIQIGAHSFLSVDLIDDAEGRVVAVRKWYNTKNDSEIKPGRGGFNIQPKPSELKLLAAKLKAIANELDAEG